MCAYNLRNPENRWHGEPGACIMLKVTWKFVIEISIVERMTWYDTINCIIHRTKISVTMVYKHLSVRNMICVDRVAKVSLKSLFCKPGRKHLCLKITEQSDNVQERPCHPHIKVHPLRPTPFHSRSSSLRTMLQRPFQVRFQTFLHVQQTFRQRCLFTNVFMTFPTQAPSIGIKGPPTWAPNPNGSSRGTTLDYSGSVCSSTFLASPIFEATVRFLGRIGSFCCWKPLSGPVTVWQVSIWWRRRRSSIAFMLPSGFITA